MLFSVGGAMGAPEKHQQAIEKHAKTDCINRLLVLSLFILPNTLTWCNLICPIIFVDVNFIAVSSQTVDDCRKI